MKKITGGSFQTLL